jgi:hypothetical protein
MSVTQQVYKALAEPLGSTSAVIISPGEPNYDEHIKRFSEAAEKQAVRLLRA